MKDESVMLLSVEEESTGRTYPGVSPKIVSAEYPYLGRFTTISAVWLRPGLRYERYYSASDKVIPLWFSDWANSCDDLCREQNLTLRVVCEDVRRVMKKMAFESAVAGRCLNEELWYGSDYRDFDSIIRPTPFDKLDLNFAISALLGESVLWTKQTPDQKNQWMAKVLLKLRLFESVTDGLTEFAKLDIV